MEIKIHSAINEIHEDEWNQLVKDNNPLIRHEFLSAMERHQCVGQNFGWLPCHIAVYDKGHLIGAMPLYEKYNSYGEFVFDHAWAEAYQRFGRDYYPKLVSAIPYTPAQSQRLLAASEHQQQVFPVLLETAINLAKEKQASGFHCLFAGDDEQSFIEASGLMARHDCQYHWHNPGYRDFDDFLSRLASRKRKNIRRERQQVAASGVSFRRLNGHTATPRDWQDFACFYQRTFDEKWGTATFNQAFFMEVAKKLPDSVLLVLADLEGSCIAGSLMFCSETTLYGRHWGCIDTVDFLHFEACYYQGIEFCIERGLQCFEPGAGGEHKIARGFVPVLTRSSHWIEDPVFKQPVADFVRREQQAVQAYIEQQQLKTPYKKM